MKRKHGSDNSSLDLFLDTISNTFGGILFIAILVSIMLQRRTAEEVMQAKDAVPVSAERADEIAHQLEHLSQDRQNMLLLVEELRKQQPPESDTELARERQTLDTQQELLQQAIDEQSAMAQQLTDLLKDKAELQARLDQLHAQSTQAQDQQQQEQQAFEEALLAKTVERKVPKVETLQTTDIRGFILRYGRLYALHEPQTYTINKAHIQVEAQGPAQGTITPLAGKGWDLSNTAHRMETEQFLTGHDPAAYLCRIAVYPDSFAEFEGLREILVRTGHRYDLQPYPETATLRLGKQALNEALKGQ